MITTQSTPEHFKTEISNGSSSIAADPPLDKGGQGAGFGAHELLESSLAACINMAVRMCAVGHGIALEGVKTKVQLRRPDAESVCFDYALQLLGPLTAEQRTLLMHAADNCPVRQTLSKRLTFQSVDTF